MLSLFELVLRGNPKPLIGSLARRPKYMMKPTKSNIQRDSDEKVKIISSINRSKLPKTKKFSTWGSRKMK